MGWKFKCESKENIPLPPEYTFPQAFNYLNSENNSFFILENGKDYIQCAGSKEACTVELRTYQPDGSFKHYVFYDPNGSDSAASIQMSHGSVERRAKHIFTRKEAIQLFKCYFEGQEWPTEFALEDVTKELE
jgi:hypothetical protein